MRKTATINTRIELKLKIKAEGILNEVGLTSTEAIRLFYKHICLNNGLPFAVNIPNKRTVKAMNDTDAGRTYQAKNVDALFNDFK